MRATNLGYTTMKTMTKMVLVSASVMSMGALTACQSTNNMSERDGRHAQKMEKKHADFTPEQREKMKLMHAQRMELKQKTQQACEKQAVGSTVEIKVGEQTIQGTCDIRFYPERSAKAKGKNPKEHRDGEKRMMHERQTDGRYSAGLRGEPLTDAKRSELVKLYDQRLAEKQATENAFRQACNGQTNGQKVKIKLGEREINGQCLVKFKPSKPVKAAAQPTA